MKLQNKINGIMEEILSLETWEERTQYFIKLSRTLPEYPDYLKTPDRLVKGCQSSAWLDFYEEEGRLYLSGTANSVFVRGWIHLLLRIYNKERLEDIHADNFNFMGLIGFQEMVSVERGTGLKSIYTKIKNFMG